MEATAAYRRWLECTDDKTKQELSALNENQGEIEDRFGGALEFGTGGLRGVMGAGTNRMNAYVVRQATQGLARVVAASGEAAKEKGVVIAYDCRHHSEEYAREAAGVLCAAGIRTYLFDALRPTPELSFAIRRLGCTAGINITASHNPKQYNGYKVYWEDGAQIGPEMASRILQEIRRVDIFSGVHTMGLGQAQNQGLLKEIGKEIDEDYLAAVLSQRPPLAPQKAAALQIVYTPFYGAGSRLVPEALRRAGFARVSPVREQMEPDGDFPTVKSPNPEEKEGFELALRLAARENADLVLGTDPDSDRAGVMVADGRGDYVPLTGNQVGILLADYLIRAHREAGTLPENAALVTTIVSTLMADAVCRENGLALFRTLTGFKYIGEKIHEFEQTGSHVFLFGFEESYGYLTGTYARDKDAVVASLLIACMAADYKAQGVTLSAALEMLYHHYGYYNERLMSFKMEGYGASERMEALMRGLRRDGLSAIGGVRVTAQRDYLAQTRTTASGIQPLTGLPISDVLYFELADGSAVVVRPSGTEPKVKLYMLAKGESGEDAVARLDRFESCMRNVMESGSET